MALMLEIIIMATHINLTSHIRSDKLNGDNECYRTT
jgi:hypothetical protein